MKKITKKKDLELVPSKKHSDRADILSANPREDTIKVRATKNGKKTTKTLTIKIEKIKKQKKSVEELPVKLSSKKSTKKRKGGDKNRKKTKTKTKRKQSNSRTRR